MNPSKATVEKELEEFGGYFAKRDKENMDGVNGLMTPEIVHTYWDTDNVKKKECTICKNTIGLKESAYESERGLEEMYSTCHICDLNYSFHYGYHTLVLEDIQWDWSYTESEDDFKVRAIELKRVWDIFQRLHAGEKIQEQETRYLELLAERTRLEWLEQEQGQGEMIF